MAKKSWFKIEARATAEDAPQFAAVEIYDEIGGWGVSAKDFKNELDGLGEIEGIELAIHSPGGSVLDGWAIYNLLKSHPAHVVAKIDGLAASMATVVAMAADEVQMPENAFFMIHNPSGLAIGGAEDMRDYADLLDKMEAGIRAAYVGKTGLDEERIDELMAAETWFTGSEAKELGFVDTLTDALEMAALNGIVDTLAADLTKNGLHVPTAAAEVAEEVLEPETEVAAEADDLDAGGELVEQEEQTAEADAEEVVSGETEVAEEAEEAEEAAPAGIVERVKAALYGRNESAARAELAELRGYNETLTQQLEAANVLLAEGEETIVCLRADLAAREDELKALQAEQRTVLDLVTEAGFAPEEAAALPLPDGDDGDEIGAAEQALAAAKDPREIYQAVKHLQELRNKQD